MAIYYDYNTLLVIEKKGGKLNSLHVSRDDMGNLICKGGSNSMYITVPYGYSIGYNKGKVYNVTPAHLIVNPLYRYMREMQLSKNLIKFVDLLNTQPTDDIKVMGDSRVEVVSRNGYILAINCLHNTPSEVIVEQLDGILNITK
jgi:hypothetical protein